MVGCYLFDKPLDVLCELARSESVWEHRTAIGSASYFIRQGNVADTFKTAEMLLYDDHGLTHKATGGWCAKPARRIANNYCAS